MPVEPGIQLQAALEVNQGSFPPAFQIGFPECFRDGCDPVALSLYFFHGQADPAVAYALVGAELVTRDSLELFQTACAPFGLRRTAALTTTPVVQSSMAAPFWCSASPSR